jgi:hypothetical protein
LEPDRDTSMDTTSDAATARPTTVAFVNCFDATTVARTVHLTPDEERRLRNVLAALRDYGFILEVSFEPALPGYGFADVANHLRRTIGAPIAGAVLAAAERSVPAADAAPGAVMPMWPFEADGGSEDALLSSTMLWGTDLLAFPARQIDDQPGKLVRVARTSGCLGISRASLGELAARSGRFPPFPAASAGG